MAINDDDLLLVENNSQTETITFAQFKAGTVLNDTDNFLINDGAKTEKVAWGEIKNELVPELTGEATVAPVDAKTGETLTCTAFAAGGVPPYSFSYQWYNKFGTIYGWTPYPSPDSPTLTIPDNEVGKSFRCNVTITDDAGTELEVASNETVPVEAGTRPPVIDTVTLVESNPNADPRFTNQEFTATATLSDDGEPASVKAFDAHVVGALTTRGQFVEPLESSSSSGVTYEDGWTFSSNGSTGGTVTTSGTPDRMFNGNLNNGYSNSINADNATVVFQAYTTSAVNDEWLEGPCYIGFRVYSSSRYYQGNTRPSVSSSLGTPTEVNEIPSSSANYSIEVPAGQKLDWVKVTTTPQFGLPSSQAGIYGWWRFDSAPTAADFNNDPITDIPERTDLVFAAGTDMAAVDAGDTVEQSAQFVEPLESSNVVDGKTDLVFAAGTQMGALLPGDEVIQPTDFAGRLWSDDVSEQSVAQGPTNPERMFDGNLSTFLQSFNYNGNVTWDLAAYPLTGKLKVYVGITANGNSYPVIYKDKTHNNVTKTFTNVTDFFELDVEELIYFSVRLVGFQNYTQIKGVKINDQFIINDQPIAGELNGTVESITDTTVTLTELVDGWSDGEDVTGPDKDLSGEVLSKADTTLTLSTRVDGWATGLNVTGPEKEITGDDVKMYLAFDSNGTVTDLIPEPQSPVYAVSGINPGLTLTFPATFPSGKTPDEEIGAGSRLTVEVGAANSAGSTSYVGATVQPTGDPPSYQFREPLVSTGGGDSGEISARKWSNFLSAPGGFSGGLPVGNAFDGDPSKAAGTNTTNANITWNTSTFPLSGQLTVYADSSGKGTSFVRVTHSGGTTTVTGAERDPSIDNYAPFVFEELTGITQVYISQNDPSYGVGAVSGFALDGSFIINDQPIVPSTVLNFNPLADMSQLAAGDAVNQANGTTGTVESINGTSVQLTGKVDGWVNGEDVVGPDKTPFRSLTEEELAEQKLKFRTYENRRDVHKGDEAMAERARVAKALEDEYGVTPEMIDEIIPPENKPAPTKRTRRKKAD